MNTKPLQYRELTIEELQALPIRERRAMLRMKGELTTAEAAQYLDMARQTLYNLLSNEMGPERVKKGTRACFKVEALDRWDQNRTTKLAAYKK